MNNNKNNRHERKIVEQFKGSTYRITYISAAYCPIKPYLVANTCLDMARLVNGPKCKLSNLFIHEYE